MLAGGFFIHSKTGPSKLGPVVGLADSRLMRYGAAGTSGTITLWFASNSSGNTSSAVR
jgi:hypothetical protein